MDALAATAAATAAALLCSYNTALCCHMDLTFGIVGQVSSQSAWRCSGQRKVLVLRASNQVKVGPSAASLVLG
jgi:hypothetical protein